MDDETEKAWDSQAECYGIEDDEHLAHSDVDDCLEEWLSRTLTRDMAPFEVERETRSRAPLTVVAYVRKAIDPQRQAERMACRLVEQLVEDVDEEFGDPDGAEPLVDERRQEAFAQALLPHLVTLLKTVVPWQCEEVARREYTGDELVAWARQYNPEWFEVQS